MDVADSVLELAIGISCACLPSANLLIEKWWAPKLGLHLSPQPQVEKTSRPENDTSKTASSYWSSIKSIMVTSTLRTFPYRTEYETRLSRRGSQWDDPELGQQMEGPVVFNNRLDMPSIGSTTDGRSSRSSREEDHRGLDDEVFDESIASMDGTTTTPSTTKEEEPRERKDSVLD